jgi:hypothetical protein
MLKPLLTIALLSACSSTQAAPAPSAPIAPPMVTVTAPSSASAIDLAARRAQMLGWLREYREAGAYPTDASGRVASVFVGTNGVRCPMAELLHRSGRADLVAVVVRDNNIVRLADVHDGPLHDWMLSSGLTRDEINLVQGIAEIDYSWLEKQVIPVETGPMILAGQAQVRGKIESVEMALRDNTRTSLANAVAKLPANRSVDALATAPIEDTVGVVPKLVTAVQAQRTPYMYGTRGRVQVLLGN